MENSKSIYLAVIKIGSQNLILESKMKVCPGDVVQYSIEGAVEGLGMVAAALPTEEGSDISIFIEQAVPFFKSRRVTGIWRKDCENN